MKKHSPRQNIIFLGIFLVMITSNYWFSITGLADRTPSENRSLAGLPPIQLNKSLIAFPKEFESYYSDHFKLRNWLIHLDRRIRYQVFNQRYFDQVIISDEGWLFLNNDRYLNDCQKISNLNTEEAELIFTNLTESQAYLATKDIRLNVVISPNKCTIYPKLSSSVISKLGQINTYDTIIELFRGTAVPVLDLRPTLLTAKKNHQVYYITDTHWNHIGVFYTYQEMILSILPSLTSSDLIQFEDLNATQKIRSGDLGRFTVLEEIFSEETTVLSYQGNAQIIPGTEKGITIYENPQKPDGQTVVIFHDSFIGNFPFLQQLFAEHFKKAIFLDVNGGQRWNSSQAELDKVIAQWSPDMILIQVTERNIKSALSR